LAFSLLLLTLLGLVSAQNCFPLGSAKFGQNAPNVSRSNWWCNNDQTYGFLGFSYPMEDENCNSDSNSYATISRDMQRMKQWYNATFIRTYLTSCRQPSVWKNLVRAGRDNNMGVIGMIWWDFGPNDAKMKASENAIAAVFDDPQLGRFAPYVIHSIEFNDEVGEEGNWFAGPFKSFKARMAKYGVPIAFSDDWDRPEWHSNTPNLNSWGRQASDMQDQTHVHVIPYFHNNVANPNTFFPYLKKQIEFLQRNNMKRPHIISQTEWPSAGGNHAYRPQWDNIQSFTTYWNTFTSNCQYFKNNKVGWFFHAWSDSGEGGLGLLDWNNKPKINFKPTRC